ncbi:MAG: class I SAM-dependent methyltransferase [Planctomycetota bacterium]
MTTATTPDWLAHVEATKGWLSTDEAEVLQGLATKVTQGCIVEVGSYRGRSAIALAAGARDDVPVFAIDPHELVVESDALTYGPEDRAAFFEAMIRSGGYERVRLVNLSSEVVTPGWDRPVGMLWIDGDHTLEGVTRDWECWKGHLLPGAIVAFDDAHDPAVGPYHLIDGLLETAELVHVQNVGKVRITRRPGPGA